MDKKMTEECERLAAEWFEENPHDVSSCMEHFQTEEEFDDRYNHYVQKIREPLIYTEGFKACHTLMTKEIEQSRADHQKCKDVLHAQFEVTDQFCEQAAALKAIIKRQDQTRGYPTGQEWADIVEKFKKELDEEERTNEDT